MGLRKWRVATAVVIALALPSCTTTVNITSDPPGATVTINGQNYGQTPAQVTLLNLVGRSYYILLELDGYDSVTREIPREFKPLPAIGGLLFLVPFAFANGPQAYFYAELPSASTPVSTTPNFDVIDIDNSRSTGSEDYASLFDYIANTVILVELPDGHGSGFVIGRNGYMLTNEHVIRGNEVVRVRFRNGDSFEASVIRSNSETDVALLHVSGLVVAPLPLAPSAAATPGDEVWVVGTPLDRALSFTVTRGIVSGLRYFGRATVIQTDAGINPGNSGGPLVLLKTESVAAIASSKIVGDGVEGIGFAISVQDALSSLGVRVLSGAGSGL